MMRIWMLGCLSSAFSSHPVDLCGLNRDLCSYNSYTGFADVGTGALFYWYFEPKVSKVSGDVPLILWLQGGPGSTSMLGNFFEHGPVALNSQGQLLPRAANETWATYAPVLYVDSPVGTGWSWARDQGFAKSQSDVARALARFLDIFAARHTGSRRLVLAGESYGGHYVPSLGNYLLQNPGPYQLEAVMVGDGLTDPATQVLTKPQEAYAFGLVDETKLKEDVRTTEQYGWQQERMQKFFEKKGNKDLLHIPENLTFGTSPQVEENLKADIMKSQKPHVESLLNAGVRVLLYQGQFDWKDGFVSNEAWIRTLSWAGTQQFLSSSRQLWRRTDQQLAGYWKSYENLEQVLVLGAGHLVPMNQPLSAVDLLLRFLKLEGRMTPTATPAESTTKNGKMVILA